MFLGIYLLKLNFCCSKFIFSRSNRSCELLEHRLWELGQKLQSSWAKNQVQSLGQLQANCKPIDPTHGPSSGMPCLGIPEAVFAGLSHRPFTFFFFHQPSKETVFLALVYIRVQSFVGFFLFFLFSHSRTTDVLTVLIFIKINKLLFHYFH
jgi:hypothetical protein